MTMKVFRPDKSGYIVFGCMTGIFFLPLLYFGLSDKNALGMAGSFLIGYFVIWLYIHSHEIRIEEDAIVFKSIFGGTRKMPLSHVGRVRISAFDYSSEGTRWVEPPIQLIVYPRKGTNSKRMNINAKLFKRENLRYILDMFK